MNDIGKTVLSIKLDPNEEGLGEEMHIEGSIGDLLPAYVALSKQLFDNIANDTEPGFAAHIYAKTQELILKESRIGAVTKVVKLEENEAKRVMPLLNILGKTFKMPSKEGEEE